jgi:hypothetical protein
VANQLDVRVDVAVQGEENLRSVGTGFDEATKKSSGFGSVASGAIMGVASAVTSFGIGLAQQGISAAIDAIGDSISLASDRAEAAGKAQVIFGDSYDMVAEKAENAATAAGLSSGAYLDLAGGIGNLVTNFGFAGDEAANMSTDIVQLSADVGAFNNAPTEDVVNAIGSAFRGETEPIRAFGVMLDDASVKAKAMSLGLYDGVGAIDKNAKATATYQLILEQTTKAQGNFAATSGNLAEEQKIGAAKMENSLADLGDVLLPIATYLVPLFADALSAAIGWITEIATGIGDWVDANQPLMDGLGQIIAFVASLYEKYLRFLWDMLVQLVDAIGKVADALSGPFATAIDIAKNLIAFFTSALGVAGDALNNVHRFIDPNYAALDDLGRSFIAAGEAAGLSAEQSNQAWADAQESAKAGGDAATQSMDVYIASWKAANVATDEASTSIAGAGLDVQRAMELIGGSTVKAAADVAQGAQGIGLSLFEIGRIGMEKLQAQNWIALGATIPSDIGKGIAEASHQVLDAADNLIKLLKEGMSPSEEAAKLAGRKYTKAVASGMESEIPGAKESAQAVAIKAIGTIEAAAGGTPSTKGLKAIGQYYDSLLAGGMDDHAIAVALAGNGVASDVIQKLTGYYPDFDSTGKAYDAHIATGIDSKAGAIDTAVSNATDPLNDVPADKYGTSVGNTYADAVQRAIRAARPDMANLADHMFAFFKPGGSPPKEGPLRNIDDWGYDVAGAWVGGAVDAMTDGRDQLGRSANGLFPSSGRAGSSLGYSGGAGGGGVAAGATINVYTGVGDPVAIGRSVSEALAAYQRASGTETLVSG